MFGLANCPADPDRSFRGSNTTTIVREVVYSGLKKGKVNAVVAQSILYNGLEVSGDILVKNSSTIQGKTIANGKIDAEKSKFAYIKSCGNLSLKRCEIDEAVVETGRLVSSHTVFNKITTCGDLGAICLTECLGDTVYAHKSSITWDNSSLSRTKKCERIGALTDIYLKNIWAASAISSLGLVEIRNSRCDIINAWRSAWLEDIEAKSVTVYEKSISQLADIAAVPQFVSVVMSNIDLLIVHIDPYISYFLFLCSTLIKNEVIIKVDLEKNKNYIQLPEVEIKIVGGDIKGGIVFENCRGKLNLLKGARVNKIKNINTSTLYQS